MWKKVKRIFCFFLMSILIISSSGIQEVYAAETKTKQEETFQFGDYIYFGHYAVTNVVLMNDEVEEQLSYKETGFYDIDGIRYYVDGGGNARNCIPVRWKVIADEGDTLLVLQDYVLFGSAWDSGMEGSEITWANSDIREYINSNVYLNAFFTEDEQKDIRDSRVANSAPGHSASPIADTIDKLYLPSMAEIEEWFPEIEDRRAHYFSNMIPSITTPISGFGTDYAYNEEDYTCAYWTRTPNNINYGFLRPAIVSSEGGMGSFGHVYNTWEMGVRPLMRISKDSQYYYRAPENVGLEFDKEKLVTYPTDNYQIPIIITGDNMVPQFKPYIMTVLTRSTDKSSTSSRASDDLTAKVNVGVYVIECEMYGVTPEPIIVTADLTVEFIIPSVEVTADDEKDVLKLSWANEKQSSAFEISRSTSKDGTYEVIYQGSGSTDENSRLYYEDGKCYYTDSKVEEGQEYWYKVRGVVYIDGTGYQNTYKGLTSQYSEPVSGELEAVEDTETDNDTDMDNDIELDADIETDNDLEADSDTAADKNTETESDTEVDKDVESDNDIKEDADTGVDSDTETDNEAESDKENQPENDVLVENGWREVNGTKYWYENGVKQGTEGRGKEIYDPSTDAWYWLDAPDGKVAVSKDVYQESLAGTWGDYIGEDGERYGKWVRYDADGHMVKGWQYTENGTYFFDYTYGTMAKGYATIEDKEYYFNKDTGILEREIGTVPEYGWKNIDGNDYWYEDYVRQGYSVDGSYRGKEIYDPETDAWYWLDNIDNGKKAVSKDVYQESLAGDWGDIVGEDGQCYGKWVRYDENGHMIKGWQTTNNGRYFFDYTYGTMAKGNAVIDGQTYYFDKVTGVLQ